MKATAEKGPCPPPASGGLDPDRPQAPPPASRNPDSSRPMLLSTSAVLKAYCMRESARGRVETQVLIQQPGSKALTSNRFLDDGAAGLWATPRVARGQSTCGETPPSPSQTGPGCRKPTGHAGDRKQMDIRLCLGRSALRSGLPTGRWAHRWHIHEGTCCGPVGPESAPTYMMHPMDHTSTSKLCPFLLSTSGAM